MRPSVNQQQGSHMKPAAAPPPPRGCPSSASPSRGPADNTGGVMLFGVRLTPDGSMRKSVSMGNLALYHNSSLHGQSSSTPEHSESGGTAADGYVSDGMVQAASSVRERKKGVPWTEDEHKMFLVGLQKLGKGDWRGISRNFVTTRTPTQVASHAQKYFLRQNNLNKRKRRSSLFDIPADYTSTTVPGVDISQKAVMEFNVSSSELSMGSAPFASNRYETAASNFSVANITTPFTRPFARPPVNSLPTVSARDDAVAGFIYSKLPDNENAQSMLKQGLEMGSQKIASTFTSPFSSMPLPPLTQPSYMERSKLIRPVASLPPSLMRIDEAGEVPSDLRLSIGLSPPPPPPPPPPSGSSSSSSSSSSTTAEPNPLALKLEQPSARHSAFHSGAAAIASNSMGPNGNAISVV